MAAHVSWSKGIGPYGKGEIGDCIETAIAAAYTAGVTQVELHAAEPRRYQIMLARQIVSQSGSSDPGGAVIPEATTTDITDGVREIIKKCGGSLV